ncbi:MAG: carboxyl transferase, partial [Ruminococcus sp.]|nr:carboxyl transferase [Ruminococcus sp.]
SDMRFALDGAVVSPVNPKALAFIMDEEGMNVPVAEQDKAAEAFAQRELNAVNAACNGYVDDVIEKSQLRAKVSQALTMLSSKRVETLPKKHSTI